MNKSIEMETPIYTKLEAYHRKGRVPFAMPGHKNLRGLAPDMQICDVTELAATADLHHKSAEVVRANRLLSELYKTKRSFIMTCGSTAGIQAMLSSVLKPGDTLLMTADCHMSVINTCAICGFKIKLLPVEYDSEYGIPVRTGDFEIPDDVGAVMVTSPNYYGIVKDIARVAAKCRRRGVTLLVDEAHGAHFIGSDSFPESAVRLGADAVCHSAHKTLNALTGAAYLHICSDRIDEGRVERALREFQSSSPSYPIAASADAARATLAQMRYDTIIDECRRFKEAITGATAIKALENDDITRIVLNFGAYDISGYGVAQRLSEHFGTDVEMADAVNIVLIATPWNTHSDFMTLFNALRDITGVTEKRKEMICIKLPPFSDRVISPSSGRYAKTERIPVCDAQGRIAAETVTAYPPGTAIIITGETVTKEQTEYICRLRETGADIDDKIEVVKWNG